MWPTCTAVSRSRQHSCGLDGLVRVTVTSPVTWSSRGQVRPCDGTLSAWNPFTCALTPSMVLTYRDCTADFTIVYRGPSVCLLYVHWQRLNFRQKYLRKQLDLYFVLVRRVLLRLMPQTVRLSVCRLSVTFVRPGKRFDLFGNILRHLNDLIF